MERSAHGYKPFAAVVNGGVLASWLKHDDVGLAYCVLQSVDVTSGPHFVAIDADLKITLALRLDGIEPS